MNLACKACEKQGKAFDVQVDAQVGRRARAWRVRVCRDCWRVFETMLDQGSVARQYELTDQDTRRWTWFL